jgi:Ca2+/Na+ antiporter
MLKDKFFPILVFSVVFIPTLLGFHVVDKPTWFALLTLNLVGFALFVLKREFHLNRVLQILVFIALAFYTVYSLTIENLPQKLYIDSNLLVFLTLLSGESFRNSVYLFMLSFLNLTIVGLYNQNLTYGLLFLFYLYLALFYFLIISYKRYSQPNAEIYKLFLKYSALVYGLIFVFGTVLFFVLPRPQQPIFTVVHKKTVTVGFNPKGKVKLGEISDIQQVSQVIFRAKFKNFKPSPERLYWRGQTLEKLKNNIWLPETKHYAETEGFTGKPIEEELLLTAYGGKFIFTYGFPAKVMNNGNLKVDPSKNILLSEKSIDKPIRVKVLSYPKVVAKLKNRKPLLEIPKSELKWLESFAKKVGLKKGEKPKKVLQRLAELFSGFKYSLENPAKDLQEFALIYKRGNCEYFASLSVLLFRYVGIPARLVIGFYGGSYNPLTGYWVVSQSNAHAWVEYFYKGTWHVFDATAYANRGKDIENLQKRLNLERNKLAILWDTLNTLWLEYVVDLNLHKQVEIFKKTQSVLNKGLKTFEVKGLFYALTLFALIVFLLLIRKFWQILTLVFSLYLKFKFKISLITSNPIKIYNFLWFKKPELWEKYKRFLKYLIYKTEGAA